MRGGGDEGRSSWRYAAIAALVLLTVTVFVLVSVDQTLAAVSSPDTRATARIVGIAVVALLVLISWLLLRPLGIRHGSPSAPLPELPRDRQEFPSLERLDEASRSLESRYYDECTNLFRRILTDPRYSQRLEETFTVSRGRNMVTSRAEFVISGLERDRIMRRSKEREIDEPAHAGAPAVLVPLIRIRKSSLLDDLMIRDAAGHRLVVVSRAETLALVTETMIPLFLRAFVRSSARNRFVEQLSVARITGEQGDPETEPSTGDPIAVFRHLQQAISLWYVVSSESMRQRFDEITAALESVDTPQRDTFREFCAFFAENRIVTVAAPLPFSCNIGIEYSRSVELSRPSTSARERMRRFFGLSPERYWFPIESASVFPNYHAEIDGRDQPLYVFSDRLLDGTTSPYVPLALTTPTPPNPSLRVTVRNDRERVFPHLNIRNLDPRLPAPRIVWELEFREIPPGGLGPVFAMAAATTAIAAAFTFATPNFEQVDLNGPAVVIAVPLFAITIFGYSFGRLFRASLTSVFGFFASAALALFVAICLLTVARNHPFVPEDLTIYGNKFHVLIGFAALATLLVTVYVGCAWAIGQRRYTTRNNQGTTRESGFPRILKNEEGR